MKTHGFTLVEIIVAVGLAAIFLPAIGAMLSFSLTSASQGEKFSQAYALAQEGMETAFFLKTQPNIWDWTTTPANTSSGQFYQPSKIDGVWQLGEKTSTPVIGPEPFARTLQVSEVRRCGQDICSEPWGLVDDYTRQVVVSVSWSERGQPQEVKLEAYVTVH